jgi:hypothetical protein
VLLFFAASGDGTSISCGGFVNRRDRFRPVGRNVSVKGLASRSMGKLTIGLVVVIILAVLGGAAFLALWNPPAPTAPVEKVLPDARFPK